ncbi:MAG TPA: DUF1570 domain-containing protein [Bryobacteraceae bacterium]|nr:DUF1570 domain-containing protein [Bryobacteraceae bacterium]
MKRLVALLGFALLPSISARAGSPQQSGWFVARSAHFDIYSQAGLANARATLAKFEQMRACFAGNDLLRPAADLGPRAPLRIIDFASAKEYNNFRLRPNADAYYASLNDQEYIVMAAPQSLDLAIDAHEYAHSLLHNAGLKLPAWLNEGLAEFFSTLRVTNSECRLGGALPRRIDALAHHKWLPLAQLLTVSETASLFQTRDNAAIFYAESWALTNLLAGSPEYALYFHELLNQLSSGRPSERALTTVYGKSIDAIGNDLDLRVRRGTFTTREFPALPATDVAVEVSGVSDLQLKRLLAELLYADGELDRAESLYAEIEHQQPGNPTALAAMGTIALRRHDRDGAIAYWRQAIDRGLTDAGLCYRYALLAEDAGLPVSEIQRALGRAVALDPSFDDARYKLALIESNSGDYAAAIKQLRAMRTISQARAFAYWSALSYAYMELGDRDRAKNAGEDAMKVARTASDRARAAQLIYVAETDVTEQFVTDANGHSRLAETRVPHGTTGWNPFIEPTDHIQKAVVQLREVLCSGGRLMGFLVDTSGGRLMLTVPDPQRVLMRNGPPEFSCGPQQPRAAATIEYAAVGNDRYILRGISFP